MKIIREYLLREILSLFTLSLIIITILFVSQRIIQLTEWAINRGVGLVDILLLLAYMLPTLMVIIIPIVTLFSILLAVGRLSGDTEIVAMKSAGISLYSIFPAELIFALLTTTLSLFTSQYLAPRAADAARTLEFKIVRTRTEAAVTERRFFDLFRNTTFYVNDKRDDGKLRGVLGAMEIWPDNASWQMRQLVIAEVGRFVNDPVKLSNELWLTNGVLIQEDREQGREDFVSFSRLRLKIGLERMMKVKSFDEDILEGLDIFESFQIEDQLKNQGAGLTKKQKKFLVDLRVQWQERLAFPLGCLAICFWAVPLGIQPPRAGRARPIVISVLLSGAFYYLMIMGKFLALYGFASPWIAMWAPNLLIMASGLYMLRQKNLERPIPVWSWIEDWVYYLGERIKEYREQRSSR